jgi:hypothetical protein
VVEVRDDSWKAEIAALQERVRGLEESMPLLACGPELRALFRDIRKECSASAPAETEAAADGRARVSKLEGGSCRTEQMKGAIASAERELDTKSIGQKLISLLRHEVVYLSDNLMPSSGREKRLRTLVTERRLPSTRFLVVTAPIPSSAEAEKRAGAVVELLKSYGLPEREVVLEGETKREVNRFDKPWIYKVMIPALQLKPADRPSRATPTGRCTSSAPSVCKEEPVRCEP